jgi:hypothetical protein
MPADAAAKIAVSSQIGTCSGCEFDCRKPLGGDFAVWIVVLKINVYMADAAVRKLTFAQSVDFRGNTDESWTRGLTNLVSNYLLAGQL